MFDVLTVIHHIKMLSELNTLTLFRYIYNLVCDLDTLQVLEVSFYSLYIKTTETSVLENKNKIAMLLFIIFIFPLF